MSIERRALEIFSAAVELEPMRRNAYLDAVCGNDAALRALADKLLAADESAHVGFDDVLATARGGDRSGERLGSYRLEALIGFGGMGSVYRAVRTDGAFDKPVAIKLLTFDAGDLRARFKQEQRILGNLSHTHIATLLDVGNDANGAPYLVMEYIAGVPITRYARENGLDLRGRIELLLPIIDAVQTAHSQLIVHRDIKPDNVLVDRAGTAKLLDFGIAKLIGEETVAAAQTRSGLRALTPEYASPEHVRGKPIGTPSDIYSLGVLLYELLGGARPYEVRTSNPAQIARIVCETEPDHLSTHLSGQTIAGNLRDLDAIAFKALAKAPTQRYASCAEFAADLRRWLQGEAVLARLPTRRERLARHVRRHKLGVSVAATAILALIVGLAATLYFYREVVVQREIAIAQKERAEQQTAVAEAVKNFLNQDVIRAASPIYKTSPADLSVRELLDRGAAKIATRFKDHPAIEGEVRAELGGMQLGLNRYAQAEEQFRAATQLLRETLGDTDAKTLYAQYGLAGALIHQSKLEEGEALLKRIDAIALPAIRGDDARTSGMRNLTWGTYLYMQGEMDKSRPFVEATIADAERWQPGDTLFIATRKINLAMLNLASGRIDDAERITAEIAATLEAQHANETLVYALIVGLRGRVRSVLHDYAGAEALATQSVALMTKIYGKENSHAGDSLATLCDVQHAMGRYREALVSAQHVYEAYRGDTGADSYNSHFYLANLGHSQYMVGQTEIGLRNMQTGIAGLERVTSPQHPDLQPLRFLLAGDYLDLGATRVDTARALVGKLDTAALESLSPQGDWTARVDALRGQIAYFDGDHAHARSLLEPALAKMVAAKSYRYEIERAQRTLAKLDAAR